MTSQKAHSLLSDLHRILANYDAKDFTDAGSFSSRLQPVLQILSTMTGKWIDQPAINQEVLVSRVSENQKTQTSASTRPVSRLLNSSTSQIEAMISKTQYGESAAAMNELIRHFGLAVRVGSKDGRSRILQKISKAISLSPKAMRSKVLVELRDLANSETEGWIDVLKSSK